VKRNYGCLFIAVLLLLVACDDILEPDIRKEAVRLLMPADSAQISKAEVAFRWEALNGARSYRLQVASPSFGSPLQTYIDTVNTDTFLSLPLHPGRFEWRVQALNAGYESAFTSSFFIVDSAAGVPDKQLRLLAPAQNSHTNKKSMEFSWAPVEQAAKYIFELLDDPRFDTTVTVPKVAVRLPSTSKTLRWRVSALSPKGVLVSPVWTLITDFEAPVAPECVYPRADTVIFNWPVTLKWKRLSNDVVEDRLFLYLSDQQTVVTSFPKRVPGSSFTLTQGLSLVPGNYFWAVQCLDKAGNTSVLSAKRKFTVR